MAEKQTKCCDCGRRFGEMDDEPVECEDCELLHCPDCNCECEEEDSDDDNELLEDHLVE